MISAAAELGSSEAAEKTESLEVTTGMRRLRPRRTNCSRQLVLLVATGLLTLLSVSRALGDGAVFLLPTIDGVRVDRCLYFARDCDEPAATAFCRSQGHGRALAWGWEYVTPTHVQGDGRTCRSDGGCGGFSTITCGEASEPLPASSVQFLDVSGAPLPDLTTLAYGAVFAIEARYESAQEDARRPLTLGFADTSIVLDLDRRGDGATYRSQLLMLMPLED